jgi:hypothetical protein
MGSGCNSFNGTSNPCAQIYSSDCVKYQGDPVPALGICTGDTITEVEETIINQLLSMLDGTGITLTQVTLDNCPYLLNLFTGKSKTISNLIQLLIDTNCTYKTLIDQLFVRTQPSTYQYDTMCLPTITNPSTETILQAVISELCSLETTVQNIVNNSGSTTIIDNQINTALSSLITSNGNRGINKIVSSSGATSYNFTALCPPNTGMPYFGSLNLFDSSGKGLSGTSMEGWYLCNGNNGTIDMRGFVPVGSIQGVPGGALDPLVDPIANGDNSMNYSLGQSGGAARVKVTKNELPNYTITGIVSGGVVSIPMYKKWGRFQDSNSRVYMYGPDTTGGDAVAINVSGNLTGSSVSMNLGGNSAGLENRMPYKAINWITRFD